MANYFYARVSTKEQNLDRQLMAAGDGYDRIFSDKESGKNFDRPAYQEMKSVLQKGDTVTVLSLDRLGRNYEEIGHEWDEINGMGVGIKVLDMDILDTTKTNDLTGKLISDIVLKLLSYVAQKERESMLTRQRMGIDAMPVVNGKHVSKRTGGNFGVQPYEVPGFKDAYRSVLRGDMVAEDAWNSLGICKSKWYRLVKAEKMAS
jgi:DNA invertase Pin-like site-specific DNA recombinase